MNRRAAITIGVILVLLGILTLVRNFLPQEFSFFTWPVSIIAVGVIFILAAIIAKVGGLAIPGMIIGGIGGILYYQNTSGDFASWTYMWALIPGFVGLGIMLAGLIDGNIRGAFIGGLILILISMVMFFIFGGTFGLTPDFVRYWPLILIAFGVILLLTQLFRRRK